MHVFRILIVDDFEPFRRFLRMALQGRNEFQVVAEVSDGLEALQKIKELQPDLILLDIGLPNLNGLEIAPRVQELAPQARILFVSYESSSEILRETSRLGALGYIYKPCAQSDLLPAIEAVLGGRRFVSPSLELDSRGRNRPCHEVQFYSADSVLVECFSRFAAAALRNDNAAIVLATASHLESITQKLKEEGFDIDGAIKQGTYRSLDATDMLATIMVNDVPDQVRVLADFSALIESSVRAARKEHPRVAICGACAGLLYAQGNTNAALQLEKAGNHLLQTHPVDFMCTYPLSAFDNEEDDHAFRSICAEHTTAYSR